MRMNKKSSLLLNVYFVIAVIVVAEIVRYMWIFTAHPWEIVQQYFDRYIFSDMVLYLWNAEKYWIPGAQWNYVDLFYPPGTGAFFAFLLGPEMNRVGVLQIAQWLQSMWIFFGTGLLAFLLYGRRVGMIALLIAALAFPLFDYSAYMLAETPFTSLLLAALISVILALQHKKILFLLLAGILFGLSATFKSIGLLAGLLLLPLFFLPYWNQQFRMRAACALLFLAGLLIIVLPTSYIMTERNHGKFILLSNDIMRIALVNHGHYRGATLPLPEGWTYMVQSPVAMQKGYEEMRHIDPEKDNVIAQNIEWVRSHPWQAFRDYLERTGDLVYGTLPLPTDATPFRSILALSQLLMLLLVYLPATVWVVHVRKRFSDTECLSTLIILLPLASLLVSAAIAATEPRYLHPFSPLLIVFASAWYQQRFTLGKKG